MSLRPIAIVPDPVLRKKAKKVLEIDQSIQQIIDDMIETMHTASGAGLAAPQVGIPLRIIVIDVNDKEAIAFINPEIVKREGERIVEEGCLSVPGYRGELKRSQWVKVKALDRNGKQVRLKGEDILGQALEHEIDHLNGVLYIDYIQDHTKIFKISDEENEAES